MEIWLKKRMREGPVSYTHLDVYKRQTYYEGEGFAGTIIDAFAAGLPVIASDWKYNSEIIKQGITGVITKTHSISELKNAILSINSDVEKWNFMRKNCISEAKMYLQMCIRDRCRICYSVV